MIFRSNVVMFLLVLAFELYQFGYRSQPFLALPIGFYLKVNEWVPECVKGLRGYVDCELLKDALKDMCEEWDEEDNDNTGVN